MPNRTVRPRRSVLYMPGSNARALEKARTLAADCLILDLEDAVAPDAKLLARQQVLAAVQQGEFGPREVIVRINGLDTPWGADDLRALGPAGRMPSWCPRCRRPPISAAPPRPSRACRRAALHPPLGDDGDPAGDAERPGDLGRRSPTLANRFECFVMGTNDLAKETRARLVPGRAAFPAAGRRTASPPRAPMASRSSTACTTPSSDEAGFRAECEQGRDLRVRRQDPDPSEPDRRRQRGLCPSAEEVEPRPRHHRRLRPPRKPRQGRPATGRPDGGAAACRDGQANRRNIRGYRPHGIAGSALAAPSAKPRRPHCPARSASST